METENVPFEHVDVWVPSYLDNTKAETLRLFHAGHATRPDIDSTIATKLCEYGAYSTNFSFAPGVGLPGRVYTSGQPTWERKVNEADPTRFERAGGAQVYGVKTAIGIPLEAPVVGRIVLALYSSAEIHEDQHLLQRYSDAFSKWTPEPKWKVEIELGAFERQATTDASNTAVVGQVHSNNQLRTKSDVPSAFSTVTPHNTEITPSGSASRPDTVATPLSCDHDIEHRIASILGDHMPDRDSNSMLQHFMCLRLLLLRSHDRRSSNDNETLDIIKKSYQAYSKDNRRSSAELASLLVRDWMFLSPSTTKNSIAIQHIAHNMSAPPTIANQAVNFLGVSSTAATTMSNANSYNHINWQHIASSAFDEHKNSAATEVDAVAAATPSRNGGFPAATLVPKSPRD
jgi:bHLH-MYC and R2R3-MYB transcription factors N-terminal